MIGLHWIDAAIKRVCFRCKSVWGDGWTKCQRCGSGDNAAAPAPAASVVSDETR